MVSHFAALMKSSIFVVVFALAMPVGAATGLVARPQPPSWAQLASGTSQYRLVQSRPFWFTLGGGDDSPAHIRTLEKLALVDRGLVLKWLGVLARRDEIESLFNNLATLNPGGACAPASA